MKRLGNFLLAVLVLAILIIGTAFPLFAQSYSYQPPVHPQGQFSASRPMAQYNCSNSMLRLGTSMLTFSTPATLPIGGVDCNGAVVTGGSPLVLNSHMMLDFNHSNTLTAASAPVAGLTTYTGTITNCPTANAVIGEWVTVAGFATGANNGKFGPVSACTPTTIVVPNPHSVLEVHAGTAVNIGYQVAHAEPSELMAPRMLFAFYQGVGQTGYTLGNADNVFSFTYPTLTPTVEWTLSHAFTLNGFITTTANGLYAVGVANIAGVLDGVDSDPLILQLSGTTPALTAGTGTLYVQVDYDLFFVP